MIIRNVSSRNIVLKDTASSTFIVPAYGDLTVDDSKWSDTEFRRWVRYRVRDIVVVSTTTSFGGTLSQKGTLASRPAPGNPGLLYYVTDAGQQRWTRDNGAAWEDVPQLNVPGTMTFGVGDVNIYRLGADILASDDTLQVRQAQAGMITLGGASAATISFGSTQDSTLSRVASQEIETNSIIRSLRSSAATNTFATRVTGDSNERLVVSADGKHTWGTGAIAGDTNLYRSTADTLKTDDSLIVGTNLSSTGTATFAGLTTASGNLTVVGSGTVQTNLSVTGTLGVTGATTLGATSHSSTTTAPTPTLGDSSTNVATTAFVAANTVSKPASIASGEVPVWNGSVFVRSTTTRVGPTSLGSGTPDGTKYLRDDGTWQTVVSASPIPIDLRSPQQAANPGNVFPIITALTAWEEWHWEFIKDLDGKLFGIVQVPSGFTAPKIRLSTLYNATTGVSRWSVAWNSAADGVTFNPATLTSITAQDITVPGTARLRKDVTFTLGSVPASGEIMMVSIFHEGAHANDTVAVNSELIGAWLLPS